MRQKVNHFWDNFQGTAWKGLKVFLFYLAVLSLCRGFFIFWMQDYMGPSSTERDVCLALWRGLRLSCQTAGILALVSFLPALVLTFLWKKGERMAWRVLTGAVLVTFSVLYVASFPYYRQFHSNFNQLVFNAANDDMYALFVSFVQEFYLPVRLAGALLLAYVLWRGLQAFLGWNFFDAGKWNLPMPLRFLGRLAFLGLLYLVTLLGMFGGALGWETQVDWENSGVTRDEFLNEAILDNFQALYRGYSMNHRMLACNGLDFTAEDIRNLAALLAHRSPDSDNLDDYLRRKAGGAQVPKPRHIFVVLSESYANWPLLDKYQALHIADGMRGVIAEEDSDYCPTFLPDGASTVSAVMGVVTGFADANLYLTTMPEAFAEPYPTAGAPQMERLGYQTNFWYAGPATWERIGAFTKAQGFRNFYSRGDFGDVPGSVWGCEDEFLYREILSRLGDGPSYNVILNASNHSPYDVDVAAKGFDASKVREALPGEVQQDEWLLKELGHYWYADRELAKFIHAVKEKYPDSLFVVVGDHGDRYNIDKVPTTYERYGIPFIVTGQGIHKGILLPDSAGSQIDIVPTLIELIAPKDFEYMALGGSLTRENRRGVNYGFWITRQSIGKADTVPLVAESLDGSEAPPSLDDAAMQNYINAIRSISWWRPKYGPILDEASVLSR
ncbi:MAG: sulfatase-like hydrolase/transferase [Selenomonadaceae bacterium]|nr:sulfatase-like hydrolase/transferase [Selenomonadaceae bacterium]